MRFLRTLGREIYFHFICIGYQSSMSAFGKYNIANPMQQPSLEEETDRLSNDIMDARPEVTSAQGLEAVAICSF